MCPQDTPVKASDPTLGVCCNPTYKEGQCKNDKKNKCSDPAKPSGDHGYEDVLTDDFNHQMFRYCPN
jgi:hypothetical protein